MISVDEMMTANPKTLTAQDTLADVQAVMAKYNCHHVPIVEDGNHLVGLVSQRDVLRVTGSSLIADPGQQISDDVKIAEFMTRDVFTVGPATSLRKAAVYIRTQRYGCLPIVENNELIGLITDSDFVNIAIDLLEQIEETEPDEIE